MEKYRAKQQRSWNEVASRLRQLTGNKRPFLENEEREQLLKCLGLLQKSIKIKSAQNMIERLDNITRQLGLKLTKDRKRVTDNQPIEFEVFISSDMFYVEVMIEASGRVRDVKIAHHGDPIRCPELCSVLQASDFAAFGAHLEGLIAIYRLNCDKSVKQKAYVALQNLEKKFVSMANLQSEISDVHDLIFKSPVGILVPRRGGFPMQMTYFVSPYDFVGDTGDRLPCTVECITRNKLGQRVSISIENSEQNRVPSATESSDVHTSQPSAAAKPQSFPIHGAFYTMKLSSPLAVDVECLTRIKAVTGLDIATRDGQPLVKLITQRDVAKAFHVKLPDQSHTYYIADGGRMGVMVESIQFTSSKQIPPVLDLLRNQCFFNSLISSCVRDFEPEANDDCHVFEVNPNGLNAVCVSFEHPLDCESLLTLELRFDNIIDPNGQALFKNGKTKPFISDAHVATTLQMSFSIPVVMRSILNKANSLRRATETLKNQSSDSSILSFEAVAGPTQDPFYEFDASGDNMGPESMRQKLFELENFCQQDLSGFPPAPTNQPGSTVDLDQTHNQLQQLQQQQLQQQQQSAMKTSSNQQESFDLIDDSMFFDAAYPVPGNDTSNEIVQTNNCLERPNLPDRFNDHGSESPSASGDRFRYNNCDGQQLDATVPLTPGRNFDPNQKNLLTGGDSSESPPLSRTTIPTSIAGGATLTAMPPVKSNDERKDSKSSSSKSKKSSSNHGKKKERSSSKDRSSTKSSGSSSKSSSSKSSSSKDKKRTSDGSSGGGSSRSSLVAGFDRSHQNLKKDSSSPSKHSSTSDKQFTVRQSSSAQGMKLTINKARTPDAESRSSSSSSSKHHRSSSRSKNQSSVSSNHSMKQSSSTGKLSPKDGTHPLGLPIVVDDENDAIDLVEKRLRVIHGEGASINHFVPARASASNPSVGNKLFEDAFMD